jgi:hypothetical protein
MKKQGLENAVDENFSGCEQGARARRLWLHAVAQLTQVKRDRHSRSKMDAPNPKPPNVCLPGSASEAVLALLKKHRGLDFRREHLARLTGRTEKAVGWALHLLCANGTIIATGDLSRSEIRYRLPRTRSEDQHD